MAIFLSGSWLQRKVQAESPKEQSRGQESTRSGVQVDNFLRFCFFTFLFLRNSIICIVISTLKVGFLSFVHRDYDFLKLERSLCFVLRKNLINALYVGCPTHALNISYIILI